MWSMWSKSWTILANLSCFKLFVAGQLQLSLFRLGLVSLTFASNLFGGGVICKHVIGGKEIAPWKRDGKQVLKLTENQVLINGTQGQIFSPLFSLAVFQEFLCKDGLIANTSSCRNAVVHIIFHPGTWFQKSVFAGTENAGSLWVVDPNVQDFCVFTQKSFLCGRCLSGLTFYSTRNIVRTVT